MEATYVHNNQYNQYLSASSAVSGNLQTYPALVVLNGHSGWREGLKERLVLVHELPVIAIRVPGYVVYKMYTKTERFRKEKHTPEKGKKIR